MAIARQQYQADGNYVDKQEKEFTLTQEIIEKLDSIEPGAERNFIQGIKVNGELQEPDQYRIVGLTIPQVIDELNSTDAQSSLSARQGRVLYNYIKNLQSLGKFLSNWDSTTGLPTTNPSGIPYEYHTGDYYIISLVGTTNYRPAGASYDGTASTVVETEEASVGDFYFYDGVEWLLLRNTDRQIPIDTSLSNSSTNPVENRVITQALNGKQAVLTPGANIQITNNTISATDTTYENKPASQGGTDVSLVTTGDKYNWNNKQDGLSAGANIQINGNTISATDTVYGAGNNIQISAANIISATDTTYLAGTNVQIDSNNVISATDTTYTAGTGIDITNGVISNTQTSAEWGNISGTLSDQTDLQNELDAKQDILIAGSNISIASDGKTISATDTTYTAGSNIQISGTTISATDTTYTASDFDIKDLADSTQLRDAWSGKQDAISDLSTIRSGAALGAIALQSGDNISELNNDVGYITSASLPTVNNGTLTIQKNGTNVATFTANQSGNSTANLIIPTTYSDVDALPDTTKYGASISLAINSATYVITAQLKDQDGNNLGAAQTVDLPLESVVVSGSYDSATKKVILTLKDGSTIDFSVADLISGLQSEITSANKLDANLVDDSTSTNKFVTATEKSTWNGKQNALATQTAYTSKGSATKVPQITTNTLGQVTGITEVTITQPTVNDSTITYTQGGDTITTTTTNQSSASTVALRGDIFVTQTQYDNLPSSKLTDGNTYLIYE